MEFVYSQLAVVRVGGGQLQFNTPRGIAVHPTTGLVFVADSYNNRIQVFNSDLTYAHSITLHGDKQFNLPYDVSLDSDGRVYVAEWGSNLYYKAHYNRRVHYKVLF